MSADVERRRKLPLSRRGLLVLTGAAGSNLIISQSTMSRPFMRQGPISLLEHPEASANGSGDNSRALAAVLSEASASTRGILIPKGVFRFSSTITIPPGGVTIEGQGQESQLLLQANNKNLIQAISTGQVRINNIRISGNGTASDASNGYGLIIRGGDNVDLDEIWFDNWGNGGIKIDNGGLRSPAKDLNLGNLYFSDMKNSLGPKAENAAIRIEGMVRGVRWGDILIEASSSSPVRNGIAISQLAEANKGWKDVRGQRLRVYGVERRGLSIGSEFSDDSFQSGCFYLGEGLFKDCGWSGMKTKNVDQVTWGLIHCENCERLGQEVPGNLQGSVLLNGSSSTAGKVVSIGGGSDAVRVIGRQNGSGTGWGRSGHSLVIESRAHTATANGKRGGASLYVGQDVQRLSAKITSIEDQTGVKVVSPSPSAGPPSQISIAPTIHRAMDSGLVITAVSGAPQVGSVKIEAPDIRDCGEFGIVASHVEALVISGGSIQGSGQDNLRFAFSRSIAIKGSLKVIGARRFGMSFGKGVESFSSPRAIEFHDNAKGAVSRSVLPNAVAGWPL